MLEQKQRSLFFHIIGVVVFCAHYFPCHYLQRAYIFTGVRWYLLVRRKRGRTMVLCLLAYGVPFSVHFLSCLATFDSSICMPASRLLYSHANISCRVIDCFSPATSHFVETCTTGVKQGWGGEGSAISPVLPVSFFFFGFLLVLSLIWEIICCWIYRSGGEASDGI
ncbi:hypothetical protein EV426DRAFT_362026 [Tirmania nivea]|nr:hypothetical protein EV426DRAFT_362026 [Tirmania nivea]